jgi:putative salt-induced outer membrane protein
MHATNNTPNPTTVIQRIIVSRHRSTSLVLVCLLAATLPAHAQWTGKAELGYLQSGGNTEAASANTKFDLTHEGARWRNNFYVGALYSENAEFATAERYEARYQADYKINDRLSWFGALRGEQDRFSGFAYQATVSTGASYKFIDSPTTKLDGSLGAGFRRSREETLVKSEAGEVLDRIPGTLEDEAVVTLSSNYEHDFTATTKLRNKLLAEYGADNTSLANDIAVEVSMTSTLALAVGFGIRYNSDPPPLAESTDTLTTINLVYNIK